MTELERFRAVISERMGLLFDDGKLAFLAEVLQRRLDQRRLAPDAYIEALEATPTAAEIAALGRELTVGETYFFRNREQFHALAEVALPERVRARRTPGTLRLLSAGCASGEEAYSLAIAAREAVPDPAWDIQVRAIDINPAALAKAAAARYSAWALRDTPPALQAKWFRAEGRDMRLDEGVRRAVRFDAGNLASDEPGFAVPGGYDVIFCRNVLMYFAPEQMRLAIERLAGALAPGGFLFLGHVETLRGVSDAFHLRHTHNTFYYQHKEGAAPPALPAEAISWPAPPPPVSEDWVDSIRLASERVAMLVDRSAAPPAPAVPRWDAAPALELMRRERFADALDQLNGRPEGARDPESLLLEASLLLQSGQLAAAEIACRKLLARDELSAGAHYLLALCREHAGDRDGAAEEDRVAAYLDPAFAMPRLHLGLLARRGGDLEAARRELGQAMILLKREDAARLLLFGGGFNREALIGLCETTLRDCGGRP